MYECTFVILGATGDLTKRKLIPAIYKLIEDKKIQNFALIGVAITDTDSSFMLENAKQFIEHINEKTWEKLKNSSYYLKLDFYNFEDYRKLKVTLNDIEKKHSLTGNRLFYLATMPQHFATITNAFAKSDIVNKKTPQYNAKEAWTRIVYEKPFGYDLKSAKDINKKISKVFNENQIFRIDHYLGKEVIGDIALLRFTNRVFEPLWNKSNIDSVQIIMSEKIGIEGRGSFYDSCGAIKDMIQSHMLQILSLVAMEAPKELSGKYIRDAKAAVLKKVKAESAILGQYDGYKKEPNVAKNSTTETFAALKLKIHNKRWTGVPFYIKTGKYLDKHEVSIHIKFKMVKCLLSKSCPSDSNYLTIRVQPNEGFFLELNSKVVGVPNEIQPVRMDFSYAKTSGPNTPTAYENLLIDVLRGDQSVFVRCDEIELSWKIVENIENLKSKLYIYKKGSSGPTELELLDYPNNIRWRS